MELNARSLVLGKMLKVKFKISQETIENVMNNSDDGTIFGTESIEKLKFGNTNDTNLLILKRLPDSIEILEGGRVDILMRTPETRLQQLNDFMLEGDRLTVYERLAETLKRVETGSSLGEEIKMLISIESLDDALRILRFKGGI